MAADRISDPELALRLVLHEAAAQRTPSRELRDLGDGWLLHDPVDPEPFWNRLVAPRWPDDRRGFDRRLDEVITLFATLARAPHVRPLPIGGTPVDLPDRLVAAGFDWLGADRRMVLADPAPSRSELERWVSASAPYVSIERHAGRGARVEDRRRWAVDASLVLAESFGVEPYRRSALEGDLLACIGRPTCAVVLLRIAGEPVAIARRVTTDAGSYLSSIGTRPAWRGRGLGRLVTAVAVTDALVAGSDLVHLAVEVDNDAARRLYERLGFVVVGDVAPDLLLRA